MIIFNDLHFYAAHSLPQFLQEVFSSGTRDPSVYLLGDIIDVGNCHRSEIVNVVEQARRLKDWYGERYIAGNHERGVTGSQSYLQVRDTLLAHGDIEWWGIEKSKANKNSYRGLGPLEYKSRAILDDMRHWRQPSFSNEFLERVSEVCYKTGTTQYICGHKHPREKMQTEYKGIRIQVLPRGRNTVEV